MTDTNSNLWLYVTDDNESTAEMLQEMALSMPVVRLASTLLLTHVVKDDYEKVAGALFDIWSHQHEGSTQAKKLLTVLIDKVGIEILTKAVEKVASNEKIGAKTIFDFIKFVNKDGLRVSSGMEGSF